MSVESNSVDQESEGEERREPNGQRVPYEGIVELGGALGPAFEAQAVDVSRGGMHLRTAYLPDVGQPLTCRFDAGSGEVLASGDVVWRHQEGRGGDFAIRFAELDAESTAAIGQLVGPEERCAPKEPGARVRLHIEGLGAPMRARVKGACASELTVGSELGFLQVGKHLELEDASTGGKRPARIDRVEVEVNAVSKIPQLVVTLRYDDEAEVCASAPSRGAAPLTGELVGGGSKPDGTPEPSVIDEEARAAAAAAEKDIDSVERLQAGMKGAFARGAAQVGPAMSRLARRAKTTLALLAARAKTANDAGASARRTTAPAPGGGLHTSGRRVVRSEPPVAELNGTAPGALRRMRRVGLVGAVVCAAVIAFLVLRKPSAPLAAAPVVDAPAPQSSAPPSAPANAPAALPDTAAGPALGAQPSGASQIENGAAPTATNDEAEHGRRKPVRVAPFGNGAVTHGNVLHIKMDGVIEKIEGASLPTGFTVVVPNRKSLEAAAPLAARDSRIGSIRVTNEAHGAELTVAFKDGVPNYQVRAKGDTLELVLASAGRVVESETPHELAKPVAKKARRLTSDRN
jgi:hypothetical protein